MAALVPAWAATASAAEVNSLGLSATYDVRASFAWDQRTASVSTTVAVTNSTRWSVSEIAFNLATLRTGDAVIDRAAVDGTDVAAAAEDQTILVPLGAPLAPGQSVVVDIDYRARLAQRASADGDAWEFARIDDVLTAYRWIPWLSRPTPFQRPNEGDPWVTASSPHARVAITVDRPVVIASSGRRVADEGGAQVFEARDVRDFNFAASPSYRVATRSVAGTTISFFHRTLPPDRVLALAARAVRVFSARIGAYPHEQLTIAETGPWPPIESPAHFWIPDNAGRLLPWMVVHEVAHEWFYSAVGNDQAREPFADEALADYMARDLLNSFVASPCPRNRLDHSIYDIGDCYAWVVYVQGVDWLRRVHRRAGSGPFWGALAGYYRAHRNGLGGNYEVLAALARAAGRHAIDVERFPRTIPPPVICLPLGGVLR